MNTPKIGQLYRITGSEVVHVVRYVRGPDSMFDVPYDIRTMMFESMSVYLEKWVYAENKSEWFDSVWGTFTFEKWFNTGLELMYDI